jgi:hypothetical protein
MTKKIETNLAHLEKVADLIRNDKLKSAVLVYKNTDGIIDMVRFSKGSEPYEMMGLLEGMKLLIAGTELNLTYAGEDNFEIKK